MEAKVDFAAKWFKSEPLRRSREVSAGSRDSEQSDHDSQLTASKTRNPIDFLWDFLTQACTREEVEAAFTHLTDPLVGSATWLDPSRTAVAILAPD